MFTFLRHSLTYITALVAVASLPPTEIKGCQRASHGSLFRRTNQQRGGSFCQPDGNCGSIPVNQRQQPAYHPPIASGTAEPVADLCGIRSGCFNDGGSCIQCDTAEPKLAVNNASEPRRRRWERIPDSANGDSRPAPKIFRRIWNRTRFHRHRTAHGLSVDIRWPNEHCNGADYHGAIFGNHHHRC